MVVVVVVVVGDLRDSRRPADLVRALAVGESSIHSARTPLYL